MNNWRDRNERDAKPHTIDVYQKNDVEKSKEKETKILSGLGKNISFLLGLLSALFGGISAILLLHDNNHNININSNTIDTSNKTLNKYVCEESSKGNLETLLNRSNGDTQIFIKWNSNYSNSGYTAAERCSQVAAKLNIYTNLEKAKHITSETTKNVTKICIVKNLEDFCNKDNILISIHRNIMVAKDADEDQLISPKFIDYIHTDNCRNYFTPEIQGNSIVSKREICSIPFTE
jgi:Circadian oscillating protein COP23